MKYRNILLYTCILTLLPLTQQVYASEGFKYIGGEAHIKDISDSLSFEDISEILNSKVNSNILDLDSIFNNDKKELANYKSNQSSYIEDDTNTNIGTINTSSNGGLVNSSQITFQKGTGYPMINGKVDFGARINTGVGSNSKFPNVQFPFDINRVKSMNKSININPTRGVSGGHKGMDFNTRVSNMTAEDGSASYNNPNKIDWNNQGKKSQDGASVNYYAMADGVVTATYMGASKRPNAPTGYWLRYTIEPGDGEKYTVVIMHMQEDARKFGLEVGTKIEKGQYLGRMGSTGDSSNTHLHLEVLKSNGKPIDPMYLFTPDSLISKLEAQKGSTKLNNPTFKSWASQNGLSIR